MLNSYVGVTFICFFTLHFLDEEVSLDTKNALLALVAYQGLGSRWAHPEGAAEVLKSQEDLSWWPPGQEEGEGATRSSGESEGVGTGVELCEVSQRGGRGFNFK